MAERNLLEIEGARIIFRNFSGKADKFNAAGNRNFHVVLDPDTAMSLADDGWNIKMREPREEGDEPFYHMQVAVRFENFPPKIVLVTKRNQIELNEDTVGMLDNADIADIDLIISPSRWEVNGKTGIKAYLKTMYVTIVEDRFADKYAAKAEEEDLPFA